MKTTLSDAGKYIQSTQWLEVLDELNIGALLVDMQRRITAMNCTAQALLGVREEEAIGKDCREVFCGVPCMVKCLFHDGEEWDGEPSQAVSESKDSQRLLTRLATLIYDPQGRVAGCLTILQDHSPIVDLINRVHYEERSLKMILENLDVGIFTVNKGGHITFLNAEAERITGYRRQQILGKPCAALFSENDSRDICLLKDSIADGRTRVLASGRITVSSGRIIPVRASYMALHNEKGSIVGGLATFHDLTEVHQLKKAITERYTFQDMIGKDPSMQKIFEMARVVAMSDATVLIEGPTGTGKDLLAKIIHSIGRRSAKPFIKVNCAALPDTLLESEMFGYVKGAFTGAFQNKPGRFQQADGGTIFLDEIGDLPLTLQAKLLRVLEDKDFYPLGSRHPVTVDVRIISATNRRLDKLVEERLFREDLFYRLNVVRIELPALKNRKSDIPLLIQQSMGRLCPPDKGTPRGISDQAMDILLNYDYPGNIRELENILEHALIVGQSGNILPHHLPDYLHQFRTIHYQSPPVDLLQDAERQKILQALENHGGSRAMAAKSLQMNRSTLWRKMKRFQILS
jgi:PAS domain S-box-containing protein